MRQRGTGHGCMKKTLATGLARSPPGFKSIRRFITAFLYIPRAFDLLFVFQYVPGTYVYTGHQTAIHQPLDCFVAQEHLDRKLLERQALETGICPVREDLYTQAFGT